MAPYFILTEAEDRFVYAGEYFDATVTSPDDSEYFVVCEVGTSRSSHRSSAVVCTHVNCYSRRLCRSLVTGSPTVTTGRQRLLHICNAQVQNVVCTVAT
ncbi:hypothetical protein V494_03099 [Pseudogymnoascus sp. VKM F-4513 (FW-928)]|nr:hypothetical protein V494_03099 [Pseudogymnoascus sp. VKM F-4513 (FW-928)]